MAAGCNFFLTTDDRIIKKMKGYPGIAVMDPAHSLLLRCNNAD